MKIAYLGPTGTFGGVRVIVEHLNRLSDRGHDCTLISSVGAPVAWLPCRFAQRPQSDAGAGYDVVVGTAINTWPDAIGLAAGGRVFGLLQMAEWLMFPRGSAEARALLEQFTAPVEVLAISTWLARLAEAGGHVTHRIRNGIDPLLFFPDSFPDVPAFDGLTIVTEGYSHNPAKDGEEYFKRAVRRLRWDEGRALRVIGFSQYEKTFEFDAYWQNPAQEIIRKIYTAGDIFAKASRYEGRPGPDLEAMACGAVVCRAIGTGDDDLIHETNCLVSTYGDFEAFVDNLRRLCDDAALRARLRAGGLEYVRGHADWPGAIDLVEQALTGSVTAPQAPVLDAAYSLDTYNAMQREIVHWETPQAMWLGETLAEIIQPASVIDIGCGPGIYLVPFKPAARVLGVDGAPEAGQALEPDEFVRVDLRDGWRPPGHYDLSLCIETAEHLPPEHADALIDLLAGCSEVVFFSAASPGQGGHNHLNEQEPGWWLGKFRERGFDLHPRYEWLAKAIAANPHCQRVRWLISNAFLVRRVQDAQSI